jgi:hypothetical protein
VALSTAILDRDLDQKQDFASFVRHGAIRVGRMSSGEAMTGELLAGAAKACRQCAFAVYNQCKVISSCCKGRKRQ